MAAVPGPSPPVHMTVRHSCLERQAHRSHRGGNLRRLATLALLSTLFLALGFSNIFVRAQHFKKVYFLCAHVPWCTVKSGGQLAEVSSGLPT